IDIRVMQITAWVAVFAVPQLFFMSAIFETGQIEALQNASSIVWWAVVYLGLVMTAFGYLLWNNLIRNHNVGKVAPFLLLLPIFSLIGGVVFLGETPTLLMLIGGVIILLGVGLITIPQSTINYLLKRVV
ncbi:MAG: EamA family transporter, partial [Amylibacter sp.]|nr:EamA family transporter [Amylibacter sp.]